MLDPRYSWPVIIEARGKRCRVPDCIELALGYAGGIGGYCRQHYMRLHTPDGLRPDVPLPRRETCRDEDCTRKPRIRDGLCRECHDRQRYAHRARLKA